MDCQASLSMEFSRQAYWNGLPFSTPGDLPDPGIEPVSIGSSTLVGGFLTTMPPGKLKRHLGKLYNHCSMQAGCQVIRILKKTDGGLQVVGTKLYIK